MTKQPPILRVTVGRSAVAMLAAMIRGAEPAFPTNRPVLPKPPQERDITPRQRRARENQLNQAANRERRERMRDPEEAARQRIVAKMTNWQRSQWARAGYPKDRIREFAEKVRGS